MIGIRHHFLNLCSQSYLIRRMSSRTLRMTQLLENELATTHLGVINESHMHNVPKEAETHFKIVVVSPQFIGMSRVKREQKIQGLLKDEMDKGLHALSIVAKTPEEWEKTSQVVEPSPNCKGGFGK